ncbi:MAG TPA: antibiotic biosynthesis monooxygenase [Dehalococcoidia bacterium]|nr:antibiotic biosynthesis monooxygenase [Dehalococcoidia bacterium]
MYIAIRKITVDANKTSDLTAAAESAHALTSGVEGFRWAMLLRSSDDATRFATVSMWLTTEAATSWAIGAIGAAFDSTLTAVGSDSSFREFDVAMARGSMTPATYAVMVEWDVPSEDAAAFANRWNAVYHAVEDAIGSRLLRDLEQANRYVGFHVVTKQEALKSDAFVADIDAGEGVALKPVSMARYSVVLLGEA